MDDAEFDRLLIAAAFDEIAQKGWMRFSLAEAARAAGLPLAHTRLRFPGRGALLLRFGRMMDAAALAEAPAEGPVRDKLFGLLMRRIDMLQAHRSGVIALLRAVPFDPLLALVLAGGSLRSMGWMLEAAGISAAGPIGGLRAKGLLGVWLSAVRAWQRDHEPELGRTMAALDDALRRAERMASWLPGEGGHRAGPEEPSEPPPPPEPPPPEPEPPTAAIM